MAETPDTGTTLISTEELELALQALELARRKCNDDSMRVQLNRGIGALKRALGGEPDEPPTA